MTTLPEEAVKAAIRAWFEDTRPETVNLSPLPEQDRRMRLALTAAIPFMMNAPCGYRLIPQQPTQTVLEIMAFNLSAEFGADFTRENQEFALAVYNEAWTHGIRPLEPSAARELALEEILREVDEVERKVWAWSGSAFLNNELEGAEDADCKTELYSELCGIGNTMHWLRAAIRALSSPDHADAGKVEGDGIERAKFYHHQWQMERLLEARRDGLVDHSGGEAWRYEYSHKDEHGKYDILYRPVKNSTIPALLPTPPSSEVA